MVELRNLSVSFGPKEVLRDVSLEVPKGEIIAVMGSSGGGKTTLLRAIAGLLRPQSGEIVVAGVDVLENPEGARRKMGMVFQSAALFDFMNVAENVLFGARRWREMTEDGRASLLRETLEAVGLAGSEAQMPSELSGGMKKRVGIARALTLHPEVILYDEPTTGLDPITAYTIDQLIRRLRERYGVTTILVSHDVNSVWRTADRIAFLHRGGLEFVGTVEEFGISPHPAIRELVEKSQMALSEEPGPGTD